MADKSDEEKKEHVRRKYAYAYYKLKQYFRTAIKRNEDFLKENKMENDKHNLTAVQTVTYKASLKQCEKLENDYEKNGTQNL